MELIILIVLIGVSSFFSATETAFFSLHASKIRFLKKQKAFNIVLVEKLKKTPEKLLITVLIGNTLANLAIGAYSTAIAIRSFGSIGIGLITGISTMAVLLFGEIIPKSFAYNNNVRVAQYSAYPLFFIFVMFYPITYILDHVNKSLNKKQSKSHGHITEDEVLIMSRMSVEKGGIGYNEHELIEKIFKFNDTIVGKIMTAFPRIEFLNGDVKIDQIAYHISKTEHSRYPVYVGSDNNIIGYVHVNSVMKALNSANRDELVSKFVNPIQKIDENVQLDRVFRSMNKNHAHMYLVHKHKDPKTIVGLITLEDILEELVGEIEDETDLGK
jgi:putative hemolysin